MKKIKIKKKAFNIYLSTRDRAISFLELVVIY